MLIMNIYRYVKGIFNENIGPTVALEFGTKIIKLKNGVNIKVQIWDTGKNIYKFYLYFFSKNTFKILAY